MATGESNLHEFEAGLIREAEEIEERVEKLHRAILLEALRGVVLMTPVDRGRARGGWQTTHGEPAAGSPLRLDKSGQQTIAEGAPIALSAEAFTISYLTNNVIYIVPLENGHSKQAPRGMAAVTVARLKRQFN